MTRSGTTSRAHGPAAAVVPGPVNDPVGGMAVDPHAAAHRSEHGSRTKFVAEPTRYLAALAAADAASAAPGVTARDRADPARVMTIGDAAEASGVSAKMIRYYEAIGLVPPAARERSGYRLYGPGDVRVLRFIGRARALDFPVRTVAELLALWRDGGRSNAAVRRMVQRHVRNLRRRLAELEDIVAALDRLLAACPGDGRPDCPILDDLADAGGAGSSAARADPARL